jgi:hypothetical protein
MKEDLYKEIELELRSAKDEIADLKVLVDRLKEVIKVNDLEDEIPDISCTSVEEQICIDGINHISTLVRDHMYDDKDVKNFNTLYTVLRAIRGQSPVEKKGSKSLNKAELLKIVGNSSDK